MSEKQRNEALRKRETVLCIDDKNCQSVYWTSGQRIQLYCNSEFEWKPSSLSSTPLTFTDWAQDQPACSEGDEFCLLVSTGAPWSAASCYSKACAVCEISDEV